jgi:hypothetical protein
MSLHGTCYSIPTSVHLITKLLPSSPENYDSINTSPDNVQFDPHSGADDDSVLWEVRPLRRGQTIQLECLTPRTYYAPPKLRALSVYPSTRQNTPEGLNFHYLRKLLPEYSIR